MCVCVCVCVIICVFARAHTHEMCSKFRFCAGLLSSVRLRDPTVGRDPPKESAKNVESRASDVPPSATMSENMSRPRLRHGRMASTALTQSTGHPLDGRDAGDRCVGCGPEACLPDTCINMVVGDEQHTEKQPDSDSPAPE